MLFLTRYLPSTNGLLPSADEARNRGDWLAAATLYGRYLSRKPEDAPIWVQLGHAEKERGNVRAAQEAYDKARLLAPDDADVHLQIGHLLNKTGQSSAALAAYERAFQLDPVGLEPSTVRTMADLARNIGNWSSASTYYRAYLSAQPQDAAIWLQLGHAEKELGKLRSAQDAYDQAATLSPDEAEVYLQIGHVLRRMEEDASALLAYSRALQLDTTVFDAGTARAVGDLARSLGSWDAAVACYEAYVHRAPEDGPIWVQLGHARKEIGDLVSARQAYEEASRLSPESADIHLHLAEVLKACGETAAALDRYEMARKLRPDLPGVDREIEQLSLRVPGRSARVEDHVRQALSPHFDREFYLRTNPDVGSLEIDPISHYHFYGWRERRNPSRRFDTAYYLATNEDVAAANMDPLLHWAWAGRLEGRLPIRPLHTERSRLESVRDPRDLVSEWAGAADHAEPMELEVLQKHLCGCFGLVLSISHDDYARHPGGVQNLIGDEQRHCSKKGWSYLHLSPAAPVPVLADVRSPFADRVSIRLNGVSRGIAMVRDLATVLSELRVQGVSIVVTVHHLMGHAPEQLLTLIEAAGVSMATVWVHDFFTICPSYTLMRNDVTFCGGPPIESGACSICCYKAERERHQARITAFFAALKPQVMAPSQGTLELWLTASTLPHRAVLVQPLVRLFLAAPSLPDLATEGRRPLRVAHLGARVYHKGWHIFEDLALEMEGDPRYEFRQLGKAEGPSMPSSIGQVPVNVTPERRNAMVEAISTSGIDIVVAWSVWPETFSYTTHEALAGGAFVVACRDAGNVWPAVQLNAPNQGCVVKDRDDLLALFRGPQLAKLARQPRARGAVMPENGLADYLPQAVETGDLATDVALIRGGA